MSFFRFIAYFIFLYPLYMSFVWMIGGLLFSIRREQDQTVKLDSYPLFSIIIPAHNEEVIIGMVLNNLKDLTYPNYEVIVVNDASTDRTGDIIDNLVKANQPWLRIIHLKENRGKANALNMGIMASKGHFLVTIDADCMLDKNAIQWFAFHLLSYPRVGAITGNPRVWNRTALLGKIQTGEYSSIIGLIKRTQRIVGKLLTVSGVIAAYRKSAILSCGLFDSDTVTEDIDITWKLQRQFWDVRFEPRALCWVLVPETLEGLWRQRVRWAQGGLEVLIKHLGIWTDFKYRRIWPIYVEYSLGVIWAIALSGTAIAWLILELVKFTCSHHLIAAHLPMVHAFGQALPRLMNPLYPQWYGSVLCLACLLAFLVSFVVDQKYEKNIMKYYFWVVWYPMVYWFLIAITTIKAIYNVVIRRKKLATWKSPDRGLHTLEPYPKKEAGSLAESVSGTAYPEIIDEKDLRTKKRVIVETSITLGFWGLTFYLFITFLTFLLWLSGLKLVYSNIIVGGYPEMAGLFAKGMFITIVIILILLLWSHYNRALIRIKGERRKSQVFISFDQDMADFFNIDIEAYREIIDSPVIAVSIKQGKLVFSKIDLPTFQR